MTVYVNPYIKPYVISIYEIFVESVGNSEITDAEALLGKKVDQKSKNGKDSHPLEYR